MKNPSTSPLQSVTRRNFLKTTALAASAVAFFDIKAMAGPFTEADFRKLVPLDKKLTPQWLQTLTERGGTPVWRGGALKYVGMPCNGIATGQVYFGGDGRLWRWAQLSPDDSGGIKTSGARYKNPDDPAASQAIQGAALKVTNPAGVVLQRRLDKESFPETEFSPRWPIGLSRLSAKDFPVESQIQGWSPFIPGKLEDSSWPVSVLSYRLTNTYSEPLAVELAVWLDNVLAASATGQKFGVRRSNAVRRDWAGGQMVSLSAVQDDSLSPAEANKVLFAGFESGDYGDWTVEGTAFGTAPAHVDKLPNPQIVKNVVGKRFAGSFTGSDVPKGMLRSPEFTVELPYINFLIGGGNTSYTRIELMVNGLPVRRSSGENSDVMKGKSWNVAEFKGQRAQILIADEADGAWGHVDVDQIEFSDQPAKAGASEKRGSIKELTDYGTMALGVLGNTEAGGFAGAVQGSSDEALFNAREDEVSSPVPEAIRSVVGRKLELAPGETAQVDILVSWNMPVNPAKERNAYATSWPNAAATLIDFEPRFRDLAAATEEWTRTWYDNSSLPHWLMQRAAIPANCLQTQTATRLANRDGVYHLWEGTTCCQGNCTHVWHYAQASARLFPELERQCRERIDLGLGLSPEGRMAMRWSSPDRTTANTATDGTAGTIMRVFREHQMSADDGFLRRVWPEVKRVMEYQIQTYDPDKDGILTGGQRNTLDAEWFGKIPWITSLHLGSLQASGMMAEEMDDASFAERCRKSLESGRAKFVAEFYDASRKYFVMREDPAHPKSPGTYNGCHIDQVMGQGWAYQIGMPRVLPEAETRTALESIWKNNFTPDVGPYRGKFTGGRWYSMPGEAGTLITTFPDGGAEDALKRGVAQHSAYMNETMTGFEWQVSAHMVWEGLLTEGLAVGKAIADRYAPEARNPFNEIECGDHYSRAMASWGTFLAVCGFTYHGPKGRLGYAPKIRPEAFKAPFTAAEGWGTLEQTRQGNEQVNRIRVRQGRLRLNQLDLELPDANARLVEVSLDGKKTDARVTRNGTFFTLALADPLTIQEDAALEVTFHF